LCFLVATLGPASKTQGTWLGAIFACAMLLPLPVIDYWRTVPSDLGYPPFSWEAVSNVLVLAGYLVVLAGVAAVIAGLVSPFIYRQLMGGAKERSSG